jgi:hypothetical protein
MTKSVAQYLKRPCQCMTRSDAGPASHLSDETFAVYGHHHMRMGAYRSWPISRVCMVPCHLQLFHRQLRCQTAINYSVYIVLLKPGFCHYCTIPQCMGATAPLRKGMHTQQRLYTDTCKKEKPNWGQHPANDAPACILFLMQPLGKKSYQTCVFVPHSHLS